MPARNLRLEVTWDAWANNSLIELGIPNDSFGIDSVFFSERNTYPVLYSPNPMRRTVSNIWSDVPALPMSVAIGLGTEKFRLLIRGE